MALFEPEALLASFDQLCQIVEEVEGVRFRELFSELAGPEADGDMVMQQVLESAVIRAAQDKRGTIDERDVPIQPHCLP